MAAFFVYERLFRTRNHFSSTTMIIRCGSRDLDLSSPKVMGILNVTPDSFFDGGSNFDNGQLFLDKTLHAVEQMLRDGADIVDIGGESTRPGAAKVSVAEECQRVLPVVAAVAERFDTIISVDTSTPEVMRQAAQLGAGIINDVRALERDGALAACVETGLPVCLMHMQGTPQTMQDNPDYNDVVDEVSQYLQGRVAAVETAAVGAAGQIILDPGLGFGKSDGHNLALLNQLSALSALGYPTLIGVSRKSMIGRLLGREPNQRLAGSLGFAMAALVRGASILRVHDVAETRDIVEVFKLTHLGSQE
ncbi:dihydropteroate synthase [Teredinibacter turnerae]|uniref:dihydropteroate synthase n=1 Tax=Teredinibacter turnerae TaxID=2426 RepID=UPI000377C14D|nr:dihydropteroate synthase [Teredinibacter turnerae]